MIVAGGLSNAEDGGLPEQCAGVFIEGVDRVMLCCHVEDIAQLAADGHIGEVEWLGIDFAVRGVEPDFAELGGVYVALGKDGLLRIEPVARKVVMIGDYIGRIGHRDALYRQGERGGVGEAVGCSGECDG